RLVRGGNGERILYVDGHGSRRRLDHVLSSDAHVCPVEHGPAEDVRLGAVERDLLGPNADRDAAAAPGEAVGRHPDLEAPVETDGIAVPDDAAEQVRHSEEAGDEGGARV